MGWRRDVAMPNELGIAKRNLSRSRLHCRRIQVQVGWIFDHYADDHPEFSEHLFAAARFARELDGFLERIHEESCSL